MATWSLLTPAPAPAGFDEPQAVSTGIPVFHFALSSNGNSFFVWDRYDHENSGLVAEGRARASDGRLGPIVNFGPVAFYGDHNVGMSDAGNALVIWHTSTRNRTSRVRARMHFANGTLGPIEAISPVGEAQDQNLVMAVDGRAFVFWATNPGVLRGRFRDLDGKFGPILTPFGKREPMGLPQAAIGADGRVLIVWASSGIYSQLIDSTGVVGPKRRISSGDPALAPYNPRLAMAPNGKMIVAWQDNHGIKARLGSADGEFGPIEKIADRGMDQAVAINEDGAAIVAWVEDTATYQVTRALARTRQKDGAFGPPVDLDGETGGEQTDNRNPSVAIDTAGRSVVTWVRYNGTLFTLIVARTASPEGVFGRMQKVSGYLPRSPAAPQVQMTPAGDALAAWEGPTVSEGP